MPPIKRYSVNAEHFICFHVWTENFCSGAKTVFAPKVAFSNLSGIVWTINANAITDEVALHFSNFKMTFCTIL